MIRVTVWNEFVHEQGIEGVGHVHTDTVREHYPDGMHVVVADAIKEGLGADVEVRTATLQEPEHGLTEEVLASTDVLTWWGHAAHAQVDDAIVDRVQSRVLEGMGLIVLHSGHFSKPFRRLMGTSCGLRWREADDREVVWNVNPTHPIAEGVGPAFVIPEHEMYGEFFDIPAPDELVFISSFTGGEVFRSGCCFYRGRGRVFYFSPGHETYPIFHQPEVRHVLCNAVRWARTLPSPIDTRKAPNAPLGWFEKQS